MEIPNYYLIPKWLESLMGNKISRLDRSSIARKTFPDNTILKLEKHNGEIGEYIVKDRKGYQVENGYEFFILSLNGGQEVPLKIVYKKDEMFFPIITNDNDYEDVEPYRIILDINPVQLHLSRLRLAFAMSLNERLGRNSLLNGVPQDIITLIGENILEEYSKEIRELEEIDKMWAEIDSGEKKGGGKNKKRKSKKRRKTRKRKSKRKKHKTKQRRKS